jgi:hypothetical protein
MFHLSLMTPLLILVCWTLVMWIWMYAARIPAMQKAGVDPAKIKEGADLDGLPIQVRQVAHNYNHLHEQPVIFYALCIYAHTQGVTTELTVTAAWVYVGLRIAHSIFQATVNFVPVRFGLFLLATLCLFVIAGAQIGALFS